MEDQLTKPKAGKRAKPQPDTHTHLLKWLEDHPLISIYGLEKHTKVPLGTVSRALQGLDKLPAKHYPKIAEALHRYGYMAVL